jgi:hypothetical protein
MGYEIKKYPAKADGTQTWYVKFNEYKAEGRVQRHIPRKEYPTIGISPDMTFEQAREVLNLRNAKRSNETQEARINRIRDRVAKQDKAEALHLPRALEEDFIAELKSRFNSSTLITHWRASRNFIIQAKIHPKDWSRQSEAFYKLFAAKKVSVSYAEKMIRVMNMWLEFFSSKTDKYHRKLEMPSGPNLERISEAFYSSSKPSKESAPISPDELKAAKDRLKIEHYNYLFLTVWLGLRPIEIDRLYATTPRKELGHSIDADGDLVVYQWKLTGVKYEKRWKYIALQFPEMQQAGEIIRSKQFKRPRPSLVNKWVKEGANCYGGRKGG